MHQVHVHTLSLIFILSLCVLLAPGYARANADGEMVVRLQCGDTRNVTSPNYPDNYRNNKVIRWYIENDPGKRIIVTFNDFQTEIGDLLYIKEENYPSAEAKYRGSKPFTPYVSLGNHLQMIFESDGSHSKKGFHLTIFCLNETDSSTIHEAYEGQEHTRIFTHPVCRDTWQTNVADTICREAGFPGSFKTDFVGGFENDSRSDGISYQCSKSTFRLQDCKKSASECTIIYRSTVIKCNVLGKLGCYDLSLYDHLLASSVELNRDECVTYCKAESTTPQYAAHLNRSYCSCISRTELNITELAEERDRCGTNIKRQSRHWAILYNVSFGFCNEPPWVNNGSWKTTSNGYMFGTSITTKCNDGYELVGGEEGLKCSRGTNSSSLDFEWHGSIPSCRENSMGSHGSAEDESMTGCVTSTLTSPKNTSNVNGAREDVIAVSVTVPIFIIIIIIIIFIIFIHGLVRYCRRQKSAKDGDQISLCSTSDDDDSQQRGCRLIRCIKGVFCGPIMTAEDSREKDPEDGEPTAQSLTEFLPPQQSKTNMNRT